MQIIIFYQIGARKVYKRKIKPNLFQEGDARDLIRREKIKKTFAICLGE